MLLRMLRTLAAGGQPHATAEDAAIAAAPADDGRKSVLNVGGNSKRIPIPAHFDGWRHLLLDIAPGDDVDLVRDARSLTELPGSQFDAIYCSHNLEHYYRHDGAKVLLGFHHVLKDDGFVEIRVPDIPAVVAAMGSGQMDIDDVLYTSPAGPITVHDVLYGWGAQIERSGVDFFAHKQGFSASSLRAACERAGFGSVWMQTPSTHYELRAFCFKAEPSDALTAMLGFDSGSATG